MLEAIRNDATPNFYFMQYELATWSVRNLLLVPSFAFPTSAIIKRKPLAVTARRAGWVGCNIALDQIPADARIALVIDSKVTSEKAVRAQFRRVKPLAEIKATERGWTLDVLNAVRRLGRSPHLPRNNYLTPAFHSQINDISVADISSPNTAFLPQLCSAGGARVRRWLPGAFARWSRRVVSPIGQHKVHALGELAPGAFAGLEFGQTFGGDDVVFVFA